MSNKISNKNCEPLFFSAISILFWPIMFVVSFSKLVWIKHILAFFAHLFLHSLHFCAVSAPAFAARQNTSKRDAQKKAVSIHDNRTSLSMFSIFVAFMQGFRFPLIWIQWLIHLLRHPSWNSYQHVAHVAWEQYCWRFRNSASNGEHQAMLASYPSIYTLKI